MKALVTVLAQAYRDTSRALIPLQRAGIAREMLHTNQAARPFWEQSLDLAERLGLLQRVVDIATTDPTIAAFHRPISLAYEAHLSELKAALDRPSPDPREQAAALDGVLDLLNQALLDLDAACSVIDQLDRGTEAANICRCGHRRHEGDCGVFVEPRARYCTCARFEPAV